MEDIMDTIAKGKNDLLEIIKDFPENKLIELLDFAQFLKLKKEVEKPIDLTSFSDKIINEDDNLLKRLAK